MKSLNKFFDKSLVNPRDRLLSNLEKIVKICIVRINHDYTDSVLKDLKWVEDNFISILKLHERDFTRFKNLFDPNNRFQKITFNSVDFHSLDFMLTEESVPNIAADEVEVKYKKNYEEIWNPDDTDDLTLRYIQSIFNVWNAANGKSNLVIQQNILYTYANWVYILDRLENDQVDFNRVLSSFLVQLTELNRTTLQLGQEKLHPLFRFLTYRIYLNKIFSEDVNRENLNLYYEFLTWNLVISAFAGKFQVCREFISSCIDSNYDPAQKQVYTKLYTRIADGLKETGIEFAAIQQLLKPIPEQAVHKLYFLRNLEEYDIWSAEFDTYLGEHIRDKINLDAISEQFIVDIKRSALEHVKYNKLQQTVIKLLAYCLFKKDTSVLKFAFSYNQPGDSEAIQGNKEILPDSIGDLLNLVTYDYTLESELHSYWEGHHGIQFYIHQLLLILFYNYREQKRYFKEDPERLTKYYCKLQLKDDTGSISGLQSKIERLRSMADNLNAAAHADLKIFLNVEKIEKLKALLETIKKAAGETIQDVAENADIKQVVKDKFINGIIQEYKKYNFLLRLFQFYQRHQPVFEIPQYSFGVNELIPREAFIDNWHIPHIGYTGDFGQQLAEQENRIGLGELHKLIPENHIRKVKEESVETIISKYVNKGKIIIGRNVFFPAALAEEADFSQDWIEGGPVNPFENFFVGQLPGLPIFNLYDNVFRERSFLVIDQNEIAGVLEIDEDPDDNYKVIEHIRTSFVDFRDKSQAAEQFVANSPDWIRDEIGDDHQSIKAYLANKAWIRIFKKTVFRVTNSKSGYLYEIKGG